MAGGLKLYYVRAKLFEKVLPFILYGLHSTPSSSSNIFLTSLCLEIFSSLCVNHGSMVILLMTVQTDILHLHLPTVYFRYPKQRLYIIESGGALLFHDTFFVTLEQITSICVLTLKGALDFYVFC